MKSVKMSLIASLGLGGVSLVAMFVCHLALTDIWHGAEDLSLEWTALQISFGLMLLVHLCTAVTFLQLLTWFKAQRQTLP